MPRYFNNPYNFIPLYHKVFARYPTTDKLFQQTDGLPSHGILDDSLLSGQIHCTLTAETPICISDGSKGFFQNAAGEYVIGGSTLKGLVRTNMQILGFGALRPHEDFNAVHMMYRLVAPKQDNPKISLKEHYYNTLNIKTRQEINPQTGTTSSVSIAENSASGYLVQRAEDKKYVIYPVQHWKINRNADCAAPWKNAYTKTVEVWYQLSEKNTVTKLVFRNKPQPPNTSAGILLCTGRSVGKANHLYLFPEFQPTDSCFELTDEEVMTYLTDYELRKNSLSGTDSGNRMDKRYWELPKVSTNGQDTSPWAVFYLKDGSRPLFFGRSPFFRIGYKYALSDGIPDAHKLAAQRLTLDYPYSMLGFTWTSDDGKEQDIAYRSRVSFGDFAANQKPREETIPVILGNPKPSSFADYSEQGKDYNQNDFHIRGIKQYWLKESQTPEITQRNTKILDHLKVMEAGTEFSGTIRFKNLHRDELGLLLWCLRLNEGCYQTIGKGKPLGYGRVKVTLTSVEQELPKVLYSADCLTGSQSVAKPIDANSLINEYQEYIAKEFLDRRSPDTLPSVQDFMYIHSVIRNADEVRYITLDEYRYRAKSEVLPTIAQERDTALAKEQEKLAQQAREEEEKRVTESDSVADWFKFYGGNSSIKISSGTDKKDKSSSKDKKKKKKRK